MKKLTALERYNIVKNDSNSINMTKPFKTTTDLYVWSVDTLNPFDDTVITSTRYYAEDINGGKTMRLSVNDFLLLDKYCRIN